MLNKNKYISFNIVLDDCSIGSCQAIRIVTIILFHSVFAFSDSQSSSTRQEMR